MNTRKEVINTRTNTRTDTRMKVINTRTDTRMNTRMEVFIVEEKKQALRRVLVMMLVDILVRVIVCVFGGR